jgi:hypothetical protein
MTLILPIYCTYPGARTVNSVVIICSLTGVLALAATLARLYTKWRWVKIRWDDRLMALAMVRNIYTSCNVALTFKLFFSIFCISVSVAAKLVQYQEDMPLDNLTTGLNVSWLENKSIGS